MTDSTGTERSTIPSQRTATDHAAFTRQVIEEVRRADLAAFTRAAAALVRANDVARLRADWAEAA